MHKNILVPLDGAARSLAAVAVASVLAKDAGAKLSLLNVVEDSVTHAHPLADKQMSGEFARASEFLADAGQRAAELGVQDVEARVLRGDAAEVIAAVAAGGYDLLVLSTYGRSAVGAEPLGHMAAQLVSNVNLPVLLVSTRQPDATGDWPLPQRILVPLDGSPFAEQAIPIAVSMARWSGAMLVLLGVTSPSSQREHVMLSQANSFAGEVVVIVPLGEERPMPHPQATNSYKYLNHTARQQIPAGISYAIVEASGQPVATILGNLEQMHCDLVVMTAQGSTQAAPLSAVTSEIITHASAPLLMLRGAR